MVAGTIPLVAAYLLSIKQPSLPTLGILSAMRLDKYLCKSTHLSKAEAHEQIKAGKLSVNGEVVIKESAQVHENNTVTYRGSVLQLRPFRYILMHKPVGTVCSNIDETYPSVFNYLDVENPSELHISGRLDADTSGLVLVTDDGRWTFNITRPDRHCPKVYRVSLARHVSACTVNKFESGIQLQGEKHATQPAKLVILGDRDVLLTITEGRYHQVKRMFAAVGNRVVSLHREQIGNVKLDVDVGEWRYLSSDEIQSLGNFSHSELA